MLMPWRKALFQVFCVIALGGPLFCQAADDSAILQAKFEQWQKEGRQREQVPWKVRLLSGGLSFHQRLLARIEIEADADHILKHGRTGRAIAMIQITNAEGQTYRNDGTLKLDEMKETRNANVIYSWDAFVLPGDYHVALALYDTQSGEHNFVQHHLRVGPLNPDPLPDVWRDLPSVEFWVPKDKNDTDNLFHPDIEGTLNLQLKTRRPVRIELLTDLTASEIFEGSHTAYTRYLKGVVPTLKVISQMEMPNGILDIATLDLKDRKITFEQEKIPKDLGADAAAQVKNEAIPKGLDWSRLKPMLKASDPSVVSVRVLQDRHPSPVFLRDELVRRMIAGKTQAKAGPLRVYVLISSLLSSYSFDHLDSNPISDALPEPCDCMIYYLEYDLAPVRSAGLSTVGKVEKMLKPFKVRAFSLQSAYDIRRAVAIMRDEITKRAGDESK